MPRITKKRKRSKTSFGYKAKSASRAMIARMGNVSYNPYNGVVPNRLVTTMRYTELYSIAETITGYNAVLIRANSIFDPYQSGAGHQPLGYDQLATLYRDYRVHKCKINVVFHQNQTTVPVIVGITPSETTGTLLGTKCMELPGAVYTMLAPEGSGPTVSRLYNSMDIVNYDGDEGVKYDDDNSAQIGTNPAEDKIFHVWATNGVGASSLDLQALVTVEYLVELYNKQPLDAS